MEPTALMSRSTLKEKPSFACGGGHGAFAGRRHECEALDSLLSRLRNGESQVLVLRGPEGVGKSVLVEYLMERADNCRVMGVTGVEAERELAFAGLHQLCRPLLGGLDELPDPQREALSSALGLRAGGPPDLFVVGVAVLALFAVAASEQPLLCTVNDVHWLDDATVQVLGFVARRLRLERVALVMAVRPGASTSDLSGLPEVWVDALADEDARSLLTSSLAGPVDVHVLERVAAELRGNPRTLWETVSDLGANHLAGGFGLPRQTAQSGLDADLAQRLAPMPQETRKLLLLAAADPTGDAVLLWSAAESFGVSAHAAAPATEAGLVEIDGFVRFCHPLFRGIVYHAASPRWRRAAHDALASAINRGSDPVRHAWHRAHAVSDVDERAAADLARESAGARSRGGVPAEATFLARAADLTPDPEQRAVRALVAAAAQDRVGLDQEARRLLAIAKAGPLRGQCAAQARLLDARLAARSPDGSRTAARVLDATDGLDAGGVRGALRDALQAATTAAWLGSPGVADIGKHVSAATGTPKVGDECDPLSQLLKGTAARAAGESGSTDAIQHALAAITVAELDDDEAVDWLPFACRAAEDVRDAVSWRMLADRLVDSARRTGALGVLPEALNAVARLDVLSDSAAKAELHAFEAERVVTATGRFEPPYGLLMLAAWQGRPAAVCRLDADVSPLMSVRGEGRWMACAHLAKATANNSLGHYEEALAAADRGIQQADGPGRAQGCLVELVEAAVRAGRPERAKSALAGLLATSEETATEWTAGITARTRALVSDGEEAERLYLDAIDHLGRTRIRADLGRARLLYGEWLRRHGQRVDAREQLRDAHDLFVGLGADGFAERARRELVATGGSPRRRTNTTLSALTAQETQIARMARDGHSNSEIGIQLFLSHRTVEWHLRKVFMKLGITSRRQLESALSV